MINKDGLMQPMNDVVKDSEPNSPKTQLLHILLSTGNKLLVECSKDSIWGTGVPLYRWDCLQRRHWAGNGKLSDLLMEIRDTCKETTLSVITTSCHWLYRGMLPGSNYRYERNTTKKLTQAVVYSWREDGRLCGNMV